MSHPPEDNRPPPEPDLKAEVFNAVSEAPRGHQILIIVLLFVIAAALVGIAALLLSAGLSSRG